MKIRLLSVGTRMPDWVDKGFAEYSRRLPAEFALSCEEVALARRGKSSDINQARYKEGELLLNKVKPGEFLVALDVQGRQLSTSELAEKLDAIRQDGRHLALLVGGPDGLAPDCLQQADEKWSLSALTLPHPLVRIVVAEQIYRAWTLLNGHPYHRS
ncbi:MAG: 23S rRNA (pseudouridine(1915)-N(3))-methyltransferase RlmH [Pseudomonadales bacterium]|nr:23S rRNA (pseudouridine(1915)-N(3))-methyltransferase RlmH [Pseudomonadales bacterium]